MNGTNATSTEPLEPEVLPPLGESGPPSRKPLPGKGARFLPILAGFLVDLMDLVSLGWGGLLIGFLAGYWMARILDRPPRARLLIGLMSGLYCALPGTNLIPAGTLFGILTAITSDPKSSP